jgi:hypothetical protein
MNIKSGMLGRHNNARRMIKFSTDFTTIRKENMNAFKHLAQEPQ